MDRSQSLFQASLFQVKFNFSEILNEKFRIFISLISGIISENFSPILPHFSIDPISSVIFFPRDVHFNQLGITFSFLAFSEASENSGIVPRNFSSFSNFPGIRVTGIWLSVVWEWKKGVGRVRKRFD